MSNEKEKRPEEGIPLFEPDELGYLCPNNHKHQITWSEYKRHIWCFQCKEDIPSKECHLKKPDWMDDEEWKRRLESLPFEPILPEKDTDGK